MFPLLFLFVSLIGAVLLGYIVGKGAIKPTRLSSLPPPIDSLPSSSRSRAQPVDAEVSGPLSEATSSRLHARPALVVNTHTAPAPPSTDESLTRARRPSDAFLHSMATPNPDANYVTMTSTDASFLSSSSESSSSPDPLPGGVGGAGTGSITSVALSAAGRSTRSVKRRGRRRVVIVAKQLPLVTKKDAAGKWTIEWDDNRNFLSGLRSMVARGFDVKWVGIPNTGGIPISKDEQDDYETLVMEHDCVPVFLLPQLADKFVNGFCKEVLWPMLHYVLPQSNLEFSARWDDLWQAYTAANSLFASVASHCIETSTDTIWVHNYHLLLLPSFLRMKVPRAKIGLFVHTPWPSSDVFRVLPTRQNILSSIMCADLLGFHTFDYARHFLSCIKRVMDLDFETLPV